MGDLDGVGRVAPEPSNGEAIGAVAADHIGAGMRAQPVSEGVAEPVCQHVNRPVVVHVDHDGA